MTKKEELENPNSCFNKALDDEPIFVIRAKDPIGAFIVQQWIDRAIKRGLHANRVDAAIDVASSCLDWREKMGMPES
jgi:hypothetical protein